MATDRGGRQNQIINLTVGPPEQMGGHFVGAVATHRGSI